MVEKLTNEKHTNGIGGNKYRFHRNGGFKDCSTQLLRGDAIVVSTEAGHIALAIGFVDSISDNDIVIAVDHELRGGPLKSSCFDASTLQDFEGLVDYKTHFSTSGRTTERISISAEHVIDKQRNVLYRVDKDEMTGGMSLSRNNILQLFTKEGDEKRRQLIVEKLAPRFENWKRDLKAVSIEQVQAIVKKFKLNSDQNAAIEKVLSGEFIY